MQTMSTQESATKGQDIIKLQVYRLKSGNGIALYAESSMIEDFIRSNALNPETNDSTNKGHFNISSANGWSNHLGYKLNPREELKALLNWGGPIISGTNSNMSFLTVKGLNRGITFEFEGMYSQTTIERFLSDTRRQIKAIFNDYIKEKNWTFYATTHEID